MSISDCPHFPLCGHRSESACDADMMGNRCKGEIMIDPNELRKQSAAFHHESEMSKTLVLEADTIERLTAEPGDLPESQADMLREIKQLKVERDALSQENAAIRELMNCYNLDGWTDSLSLIKERDVANKYGAPPNVQLPLNIVERLIRILQEESDREINCMQKGCKERCGTLGGGNPEKSDLSHHLIYLVAAIAKEKTT